MFFTKFNTSSYSFYTYIDSTFIKIDESEYKDNLLILNKILSNQSEVKKDKRFSNFMLKKYGIFDCASLKTDFNSLYSCVKRELEKIM